MKETLEREIKLAPDDGFVLPELGGRRLPTRVFISTYHDTPDLRLARNGVTFRHRVEDGSGLWQLKLPRDAARLELEVGGPPARPPAELTALLPAYLRGAQLVPVARLRTRREVVHAAGAEIVDDSVAVLEGQRVSRRFREVEVELLDGDERTLRRLEKELRKAGARATERAAAEALPRARPRRDGRDAREHEEHAAGRGARDRAGSRVPRPSRARPGHPPRRRPGGAAPAPRRNAPAAGVPSRCEERSSTRSGRSRCVTRSAGWAGISARPAIST